ncbi:hypothetical protein [Nocardioides furvisabuli]|nr:hypothetical protein [Nocardioides furvisabuli]
MLAPCDGQARTSSRSAVAVSSVDMKVGFTLATPFNTARRSETAKMVG